MSFNFALARAALVRRISVCNKNSIVSLRAFICDSGDTERVYHAIPSHSSLM